MARQKWYKLDNAAKIFPTVTTSRRSNTYMIVFSLTEEINPYILQEALELVIPRYPAFNVILRRGLFWYYFDTNPKKPKVYEDDAKICAGFKKRSNDGFMFRVTSYKKRISMEVFHSLADANGGMEFTKSLVYTYLKLTGHNIDPEGLIITDDLEERTDEMQDSYIHNFDSTKKYKPDEPKAIKIKGTRYDDNYLSLMTASASIDEFKEVCKKYQCTITQLIIASVMLSCYKNKHLLTKLKLPFQVLIPVNLRKYFSSRTYRNFALCIAARTDFNVPHELDDLIETVKEQMATELDKDKLQARFVNKVKIEKNFFMRIVPLFLKIIALKIGYRAEGDQPNSFCVSNIGNIVLPESMKPFITKMYFSNGASYAVPENIGVVGYDNKIIMAFSSLLVEKDIQRDFFRTLSSLGINFTLESHECEVSDEKM